MGKFGAGRMGRGRMIERKMTRHSAREERDVRVRTRRWEERKGKQEGRTELAGSRGKDEK